MKPKEMIGFATSAISVLDKAELSITNANCSLIHMDVDQSFLSIPSPVKAAIFESFARQNMSESEMDVTPSIKQFIKSNYGFPTDSSTEFIYSDCSQALFNKLLLGCIQEGGTFCFPAGSNGNYVYAAKLLKANILSIPTDPQKGFKLTEKTLNNTLGTVSKPWLYISGPTINPSGLLYSNKEMEEILTTCARFGVNVVIDTSFSGLEYDFEGWGGWNLNSCISTLYSAGNSFCVSLLGGLSLRMLGGPLKFSFLVLNKPRLIDALNSFPGIIEPHSTNKYAIKKLLAVRETKEGGLLEAVRQQIRNLENRAKRLKQALESCGWDVVEANAGVSMIAKPSAYLHKTVKLSDQNGSISEVKLDDTTIREAFVKTTGLCINSGLWTGLPGYCRFTFALEDDEFERALDCISKFKTLIGA